MPTHDGSQTGWWRTARGLVLAVPMALLAQTPPATAPLETPAAEAPAVRFRALEVHDQQEASADLLQRLAREREARREEHRAYVAAMGTAQSLPTLPDDDQKLRGSLALRASLERSSEQLKESRQRRLAILDRLQAQGGSRELASAEGTRLRRDAYREVHLMLTQQEDEARRLGLLAKRLTAFVNSIPPPATVPGPGGVPMRLVGQGQKAFYVSATPLPVDLYQRYLQALPPAAGRDEWAAHAASTDPTAPLTGVSWYEAVRFCQWLTAQEGYLYSLPSQSDAAVLAPALGVADLAFWTSDLWSPADHAARRDLKRFGVDLATVWDPGAGVAAAKGGFGEVPFARNGQVALYLVTARQTGLAQRWKRLRAAPP